MCMRFVVVCEKSDDLENLRQGLMKQPQVEIVMIDGVENAVKEIATNTPALVIVAEKVQGIGGKDIIEMMIKKNPMVNTALVSRLSDEEFHEYTEGLGVLMPVPVDAGEETALEMLEKIKKLYSLYQS